MALLWDSHFLGFLHGHAVAFGTSHVDLPFSLRHAEHGLAGGTLEIAMGVLFTADLFAQCLSALHSIAKARKPFQLLPSFVNVAGKAAKVRPDQQGQRNQGEKFQIRDIGQKQADQCGNQKHNTQI